MFNRLLKIAGIIFVFIVCFLCLQTISSLYRADLAATAAMNALHKGNIYASVPLINKAIRTNPKESKYYINRASIYLTIASGESGDAKKEYKLMALNSMQRAYEINPDNILVVKGLIPLYYFLSANIGAGSNIASSADSEFKSHSKEFYASVFNKSPNDVGVYVLLYKYTKKLGITDINSATKDRITELRPDLFDWHADLL